MQILKEWLDDVPQQFQGKEKIEVLFNAFAKQMNEVMQVLEDINEKTTLEKAANRNLDYIGDIVTLSRKDAHVILRKGYNTEVTDDVYRKVIRYKALKNTCDCTYDDIMTSMELLWSTDNIRYVENPERPATIYIKMQQLDMDDMDPLFGRILAVKPSGVSMIYSVGYGADVNISGQEEVETQKVVIRTETDFWSLRRLDGSWLLDGRVLLDSEMQTFPIHIVIGKIQLHHKLNSEMNNILIRSSVKEHEQISVKDIFFVQIPFLSNKSVKTYRTRMDVRTKINTTENAYAEVVTKHNYWCLNGECMLDGSKPLDAEISKEVL